MNCRRLLKLAVTLMLFVVLSACATPTPTAVPVPSTATRVPPTATAIPPTVAPTAVPLTATPVPPRGITLTWLGQSMFTLKVENGPAIMIDPVSPQVGYKVAPIGGMDVVTVSHEHADHAAITLATGTPKILRGLAGNDWAKVDETVQGVRIRTINVYHDDSQGSGRGKNAIFAFEANNLRVVHVGDLGHLLSPEQVTAIGAVDVLLIPVGGNFTIDAARATQVVDQLKPRAVIPMHYKTPAVQLAIEPVDAFLSGKTVERAAGNQITFSTQTLPKTTTVFVLGYEPTQSSSSIGKTMAVGSGYYTNIAAEQLKAMLEKKDFVFINVHIPYAGEIANTDAFIAYTEIDKNLDKLPQDKNTKIVLYCRSGAMSKTASETLVKLGFTNVFELDGGMNAWQGRAYPLLNLPK